MPTYDYHCDACEHEFEEFQSITDQPLKKCPECGKPKLRRIFGTGAAVLFKGSGFYQTDYRSPSYEAAAKADKEGGKSGTADKAGTDGSGAARSSSSEKNGSGGKAKTSKSTA